MKIKFKRFILLIFIILSNCSVPGLDRLPLDLSTLRLFFNILGSVPSIGGTVTGLQGSGLRLNLETNLNGSIENDRLDISSNGRFLFSKVPAEGSTYTISILSQPSNPNQICEIAGASGTMGNSAIRNVLIQCGDSLDLPLPVFSPPPGEFPSATSVSISSNSASAKIFYTTNGSNPACNPDGTGVGTEYTTSILVPQPSLPGLEIRAISCLEDRSSNIQTGIFRVTNGQLGLVTSSLPTTPPAANYTTSPQLTTLSPPTTPPPGTTIHYTVDGSNPTCASPSTPNPVNMSVSTTIRAIACAPDWSASSVEIFPYIISGTVDTPTYTVFGGNYNNVQSVGLTVITPGASIRYALTTDGSAPVATCASTLYTSPISVNTTDTRIQAIGCLSGWTDSPATGIQVYTLNVANPVLSPVPPLAVQSTQLVSATSATASATFHYTIDGFAPNCGSSTTPPTITADNIEADITVRVVACRAGFNPSADASGTYTKTGTLTQPTFSPVAGTYPSAQNVTLIQGAGNPGGTEIRYRTDGTAATCSDTVYGAAIPVSTSQTITAISCRTTPFWNPSTSTSSSYTITGTLATPTFTPTTGTYNDVQNVTITSTGGSTIYYNLAVGSDPTDPSCGVGSTTQPIAVTQTDTRIRAIACLASWTDSLIGSATFTLRPDTPVPDFAAGSSFGNTATITFTSSAGTDFRIVTADFATPPADPTCADSVVPNIVIPAYPAGNPIRTVKAIACRANFAPSLVFSGNYTVNGPVTAPTISPTLDAANRVTITANTPPGTQALCYRIGADPECSATLGGAPNPLGQSCAAGSIAYNPVAKPILTVTSDFRVRGCSNNHQQSTVVQENFTFTGVVGAVSASPTPAIINAPPTITLTSADSDTIYYRIDGTNPDCTGVGAITYTTPFLQPPVNPGVANIKAIGCAAGRTPSAVADFNYTYTVATPTTASVFGTKNNDEAVTITLPTTPAPNSIRYRLDGINPDCSTGTVYTVPISLPTEAASSTVGLRAIGCKADYNNSGILSRDYTFVSAMPVVTNNVTGGLIGSDLTTPPITIRFETATTGGRLCLDVKPYPTAVNPTCTGASCGAGMIDLGVATTGTYFFNGASSIRTAVRVCKANYDLNSLSTRAFLVPATPFFRMFPSTTTVQGNIFGAVGPIAADDVCNNDTGRPSPNVPYLALIGSVTPVRSMSVGNPFLPSMEYRRNDITTPILTTDVSAVPPTTLTNSVSTTFAETYTGFSVGPAFSTAISNCSNWTSTAGSHDYLGNTNSATASWIGVGGSYLCSSAKRLYCVESRYRIWTTVTLTNGAFGGIAGGDTRCNDITDANHPQSGRYKAFLVLGPNRIPGGSDWVFKSNAAYYRADRTTLISSANTQQNLELDLSSSIGGVGSYWSGSNGVLAPFSANNCSDFTSTAGNGSTGSRSSTTGGYFYTTIEACNLTRPLVCVEQ